jgi:hypothetical protein
MAVPNSYREFVLEQLGWVTPVTGKSIFGCCMKGNISTETKPM